MSATACGLLAPKARLIDAATGKESAGNALHAAVRALADRFSRLPDGVVFACMAPDLPSVLRYLGALEAQRAIALLDPKISDEVLTNLTARFRPAAVVGTQRTAELPGYRPADLGGPGWLRLDRDGVAPHPDLALLLPTSGSTGNPKLVRLSRAAVLANAEAIAHALTIGAEEIAPTTLPLHYSYGLSVLNSHLVQGATVLVEGTGLLGRPFWQAVQSYGATSLAGVPYHYEMLRKLRFDPAPYPALRTLTQAGGKLGTDLIRDFADRMRTVGGQLYVMYGQTEATARMAVLPPDQLADKLGSAGRAIPGGRFAVLPDGDGTETTAPHVVGEIVYRGPNVMMGYAETEGELAADDRQRGRLATGDLGYLDEAGFVYLTGRAKRLAKIFGTRVNLDDVEQLLDGVAAAVAGDDKIIVWWEGADPAACRTAAGSLARSLRVHASGVDVRPARTLPVLPNGKVDYRLLEACA